MIYSITLDFRPAFVNRGSWSVCVSYDDGQLPELRVTKKSSKFEMSAEGLPEFKDEIVTEERTVDEAEFNELRTRCEQLKLAAISEPHLGLDGETYTLTFSSGLNDSSFSWWVYLPNEWEELQMVKDTLLKWANITS